MNCISIAIQIDHLPCEYVVGLKWMSDLIVGKEIQHQDKMEFCSSHCLSTLYEKIPDYQSFLQQFLEVHVTPFYQQEQALYKNKDDPVLWHPCEQNPHDLSICLIIMFYLS